MLHTRAIPKIHTHQWNKILLWLFHVEAFHEFNTFFLFAFWGPATYLKLWFAWGAWKIQRETDFPIYRVANMCRNQHAVKLLNCGNVHLSHICAEFTPLWWRIKNSIWPLPEGQQRSTLRGCNNPATSSSCSVQRSPHLDPCKSILKTRSKGDFSSRITFWPATTSLSTLDSIKYVFPFQYISCPPKPIFKHLAVFGRNQPLIHNLTLTETQPHTMTFMTLFSFLNDISNSATFMLYYYVYFNLPIVFNVACKSKHKTT